MVGADSHGALLSVCRGSAQPQLRREETRRVLPTCWILGLTKAPVPRAGRLPGTLTSPAPVPQQHVPSLDVAVRGSCVILLHRAAAPRRACPARLCSLAVLTGLAAKASPPRACSMSEGSRLNLTDGGSIHQPGRSRSTASPTMDTSFSHMATNSQGDDTNTALGTDQARPERAFHLIALQCPLFPF